MPSRPVWQGHLRLSPGQSGEHPEVEIAAPFPSWPGITPAIACGGIGQDARVEPGHDESGMHGIQQRRVHPIALRLSLVHCPVAVHKATSEARDVRFNLLNPGTHNRVKQAWKDAV